MGPRSRVTGAGGAHPKVSFSEEQDLRESRREKKYKPRNLYHFMP